MQEYIIKLNMIIEKVKKIQKNNKSKNKNNNREEDHRIIIIYWITFKKYIKIDLKNYTEKS